MMRKFSTAFMLLLIAVAVNSVQVQAQTIVRYQEQIRGGATLIGNSWMYTTSADCFPIAILADVDVDPTTDNSSSADLILPAGSTIEKAYLSIERGGYYSPQPLTSVKLKVPGASSYQTLTPGSPSFLINRSADGASGYYFEQSLFDITALMPVNGYVSTASGGVAGRYFLADPVPFVNSDNWGPMGGWSIIIVYRNAASNRRSITVADNWQYFVSGSTVNTDVSGIRVPASGTVKAVVGVTGTYGDRVDCSNSTYDYTDLIKFGQVTGTLTNLADPMTGFSIMH
ncbi:hypothetical protein [Niabella hibiscisoli]|uniref:hypothetical protein n=1 Tax=Niabella hibiscisoli TaxID=1825928 RepID=UPI001F0FDF23|nr:hypothetical protein [Niabella hibiscisoli]MCH5721098.1 hypothetical protein [Niabella hibiscisoli]